MAQQSAMQAAPAETNQRRESPQPKATQPKSKRPRGTGSIYKMGKYWYVAYYVATGKQVTESSRSPLKSVAEHMLRDRLEKVRQGLFCGPPPTKITFEDLAQDLLNDYRVNRLRTLRDALSRINLHLRPFFGNYLAAAITTERVREYIALRLSENAAPSSCNLELALLKRMFSLAYSATPPKVARIPRVPMLRVDNVRKGFIDQPGYEALLKALPDYLRPICMTAYLTGMRRGEILALRWENVDLLNRQVRLNPGETKNGEGRTIPLGNELLEALKSQLHLRNTCFPECPLVFFRTIQTKENPAPRWLPVGDFRKSWDDACEKSGLKKLIFHDLRRSAVRNFLRAGVQESVAMKLSGHRTRSILDRYDIVSETDLKDAVRRLEKFQEPTGPVPAVVPCYPKPMAPPVRSGFVN